MCEKCGTRCPVCGHHPDEALRLPPPPEQGDPDGVERPFTCRYCPDTFPSAEAVAGHQEVRHPGVGRRLVTDAREWREAG